MKLVSNTLSLSLRFAAVAGAVLFSQQALAVGTAAGTPRTLYEAVVQPFLEYSSRRDAVLILLFIYLGYMALNSSFDDPSRCERSAAILALIGFINVPIIKFSVDWWNTLHQPASVVKMDGPAIHSSMLAPLFMMAVGFTLFFFVVLLIRMRALMLARRARGLTLAGLHDMTATNQQPAESQAGQ